MSKFYDDRIAYHTAQCELAKSSNKLKELERHKKELGNYEEMLKQSQVH